MESCLIGLLSNTNCHENWYSRKPGLTLLSSLSKSEIELIAYRSKINLLNEDISSKHICLHHYAYYITKFSKIVCKTCCDIFEIHKHKKPKGSRIITLELAKLLISSFPEAVPGKKLCVSCWNKANKAAAKLTDTGSSVISSESFITSESDLSIAGSDWELAEASSNTSKETINTVLQMLGESPMNMHGKAMHQRQPLVKRKLSTVAQNLNASFSKVAKTQKLNISFEDKPCTSSDAVAAQDLNQLMNELKSKFQTTTSHSDQVQILTCKPASWTIEETAHFFQCTSHMVRQALAVKAEDGVLAKPARATRRGIADEVVSLVHDFYQDDEFTRLLPGSKDVVSVGYKIHQQKRLLLCNLKELYIEFKNIHSQVKIGFSKFCSLRPKWCVLLGSSGSHAVCVCAIHQNAKLVATACQLDYKEMMKAIVCDTSNKNCMVHRCPACPGKSALVSKLQQLDCLVEMDEVIFKQWQSTDRTTLNTLALPTDEFIEFAASQLDKLTSHSFIAKSQAQHLKNRKESINFDTAIILVDFSENYSFAVQDEVQGFHWNKDQCTLHPVVGYVRDVDESLKVISFCFLSEDLNHDTGFVYAVQQLLTSYIKENFPSIKRFEYFSDGCSGQYKNYKNFFNLTYHVQDFGLNASWSFFATSHGKSPCDGVGGMVKRALTQASLKRPTANQILSTEAAYEFCSNQVRNVNFFLISKDALQYTRDHLQRRYALASTVPGTRSFHYFESDGIGKLKFKRVSNDPSFCGIQNFLCQDSSLNAADIPLMSYICCVYDSNWWIGHVIEVDFLENDIRINFLHPHGPSKYFHWPSHEDICWVPLSHVLCKIKQPQLISAAAAICTTCLKYVILNSDRNNIESCYNRFQC